MEKSPAHELGPSLGSFVRVLGLLLVLLAVTMCGSGARTAHCSNDADCPDADHGRAYCVHSRCVECVTNASCGEHLRCVEGRCQSRHVQ